MAPKTNPFENMLEQLDAARRSRGWTAGLHNLALS